MRRKTCAGPRNKGNQHAAELGVGKQRLFKPSFPFLPHLVEHPLIHTHIVSRSVFRSRKAIVNERRGNVFISTQQVDHCWDAAFIGKT